MIRTGRIVVLHGRLYGVVALWYAEGAASLGHRRSDVRLLRLLLLLCHRLLAGLRQNAGRKDIIGGGSARFLD